MATANGSPPRQNGNNPVPDKVDKSDKPDESDERSSLRRRSSNDHAVARERKRTSQLHNHLSAAV
jgi:hypothetical protein